MPPLRPITINDFTPGIADDPGFKYPPGQAQRTNTFRCVSNPSGALVPGPKQTFTYQGRLLEGSTPPTNYVIDGIYVTGPVVNTGVAPASIQEFKEVFVATEYAKNIAAGVGDKVIDISRIQLYDTGNPYQTILNQTKVGTSDYATQWGVTFAESRSNRASPTTVGVPVVYIAWSTGTTTTSFVIEFPDDQNPTLTTPYHVLDNVQIAGIISHQGRVLLSRLTNYSHGPNVSSGTTIWNTSENLQWSAPNDATAANLSTVQQFYPERSDGYTDMASMSANELLLIKQSGCVVVSGDLNTPLVQNLPMAAGGGLYGVRGTRTRTGYLYLSRSSGAWLWQHGDGSQHLSQRLSPSFWLPDDGASNDGVATYNGGTVPIASCYSEGKYAYLPNNWMFDTDTRAWWRIDDPSSFSSRWTSGATNTVFLAKTFYTNTSRTFMYEYDITQQATSYSWRSQPLIESVDRRIEIREVVIRARGTGTVAVAVTSQNAEDTKSITFTIGTTTNSPKLYRQNYRVSGDNLYVNITSTGTGGNPAPTIYELSLLVHDAQMTATSGT